MAQKREQQSESVERLTLSEIKRRTIAIEEKRRIATEEIVLLENARNAGAPAEPVLGVDEMTARQIASGWLNGSAPPNLTEVPKSRLQQLRIEVRAADVCLEILKSDELRARASEAAEFALQHADHWKDLVKRVLLAALTLQRLEREAADLRRQARGVGLPLCQFIGSGRSVLDPLFAGPDPLSVPVNEAIAAGILSAREVAVLRRKRDA